MTLCLELQRQGFGPDGRWGRWYVIDDATGAVVGLIVETQEWLGARYGLTSYTVSTNPEHLAHGTGWRSTGHPTTTGALVDLQTHLMG